MGSPYSSSIVSTVRLNPEFDADHEAFFPEPHASNLVCLRSMKCTGIVRSPRLDSLLATVDYACQAVPLCLYRSIVESGSKWVCPYGTWVYKDVGDILETYGRPWSHPLMAAIKSKDLNVVKWACMMGYKMNHSAFVESAQVNELEIMQWLLSRGCPMDGTAYCAAARHGNIDMLEYLWTHRCRMPTYSNPHCGAARGGSIAALEWTLEYCTRHEVTMWVTVHAAANGHMDMLKYLRDKGLMILHKRACAYAASGGHSEVLQWLRGCGCPWNEWTTLNAASGGHVDLLRWAISQDCPFTAGVATCAAAGEHIDLFKWCIDNNLPRNHKPLVRAKRLGHAGLIQWAMKSVVLTPREQRYLRAIKMLT